MQTIVLIIIFCFLALTFPTSGPFWRFLAKLSLTLLLLILFGPLAFHLSGLLLSKVLLTFPGMS